MINENLIGAAGCGILPVGRDGDGINWIEPLGQRLPIDGARGLDDTLRALGNPQLEQAELLGVERLGGGFVFWRRHRWIVEVRGELEKDAVHGLAGDDGVGLLDGLRRFEDEVSLGLGAVVAGEAVGAEEGEDFTLEIDRLGALDFGDGQRAFLGGVGVGGE